MSELSIIEALKKVSETEKKYIDDKSNISISNLKVIDTITLTEETSAFSVNLGAKYKIVRFIYTFPEVVSQIYTYVQVKETDSSTPKNIVGCGMTNVLIMEYFRIANGYRPISFFAYSADMRNERTNTIQYGFPRQDLVTFDESDGFQYLYFSTYSSTFPAGTQVVIMGV